MAETMKKKIIHFLEDESGQGTAEYALILLIVLMMANTFKGQFQRALRNLLGKLETQMNAAGEVE
jgi:Flp pilus assembly pilin Flp